METKLTPPKDGNYNSVNIRVGILECSTFLIKENWMWGVGIGDVQENLNQCYQKFDTAGYSGQNYNTHNEYLSNWLSAGILALFCLVGTILLMMLLSLKFNNFLLLAFTIFISVCFLTENVLARNDGILLYCFILSFFGIGAEKTVTLKKINKYTNG